MENRRGLITQIQATNTAWKGFQYNRNKDYGLAGIDTGVHELNLGIGGWCEGKLTTIAGRSSHGKTSLLTPLFDAARRVINGRRAASIFFTWEMSPAQLVNRHVCFKTGITMSMLTQGAKLMTNKQLASIREAYSDSKGLDIIYQNSSTDIKTVRAISLEFMENCKEKEKVEGIEIQPLIIIDYIGMASFEGSGLRTYGIGDFMNGLKQMASQTGCSVIALAQINRGADDKAIPQKSDLSDSQSIENASDNLILLHRPEQNEIQIVKDPETGVYVDSKDKMVLNVWKSRDCGMSWNLVDCDISVNRIKSRKHTYDTEYWKEYSKESFWLKHFGIDKYLKNKL